MKNKLCLIVILTVCVLLTACRSSRDGAWTDAPSKPSQINFYVNSICDLTDAEGRTLHCGGPNDFYGTIEGKAGNMTGEDPAYFDFTVPYSDFYRIETQSASPSLYAMGGLYTRLSLDSPVSEIQWRLSGWSIKSDGTGATLNFHVDSRERYVAEIELELDKEAELSMGLRHIVLSGLTAEPKLTVWDYENMVKSAQLTLPVQDGAATVVFDYLETDQIELIAGTKTERRTLKWGKIG